MAEAWFYHLTDSPRDGALMLLIGQVLGRGWRLEVRGRDPAGMAALDAALWLGPEEGFIPHGLAGGPHDALQPVLLTVAGQAAANRPDCVIAIDGADLPAAEVAGLTRAIVLFDGGDPAGVARARDQWRDLTGAGVAAKYWAQEGGRWVMKQDRPART